MRIFLHRFIVFLSIPLLILSSCTEKQTEEIELREISDYLPLQPGKYITYRVDSLLPAPFNLTLETHSYLVKHVVDSEITDNLGRPSYRVFRFIKDTSNAVTAWTPNGSYMITVLDKQVEVTEDNLRYIKIHLPMRVDFSWRGNSYLPPSPYRTFGYGDDDIDRWDYTYTGVDETVEINRRPLANVTTITQIDDVNIADTFYVQNNRFALPQGPGNSNEIWLKGTATDSITITTPSNATWQTLVLANQTNRKLQLDTIATAPGFSRIVKYDPITKGWGYLDNKDSTWLNRTLQASLQQASEKYAKGIGLVYRECTLWFLDDKGGTSAPTYTGFGIKMWMVDHN